MIINMKCYDMNMFDFVPYFFFVELSLPFRIKSEDSFKITLRGLVLGHPKIIKFPFVINVKLIIFRYPKIRAHYSPILIR